MKHNKMKHKSLLSYCLFLIPYYLLIVGCDTVFSTPERIPELVTPDRPEVQPGETSMLVRWTSIDTAIGWELWFANGETGDRHNWRDANPDDKFDVVKKDDNSLEVQITMTGLTPKLDYYVWVKGVYKGGVSGFSGYAYGKTDLIPALPDAVSPNLIAGDEYFIALWKPYSIRGEALSYDVYYSTNSTAPDADATARNISDSSATLSGTTRWAIVSGLSAGSDYNVWVRSCNMSGNSTWRSLGKVTTKSKPSGPPTAVQQTPDREGGYKDSFVLTPGNNRIVVDWRPFTDPPDNSTGTNTDVSRYKVYYTTYSGAITNWNDDRLIEAADTAGVDNYISIDGAMYTILTGLTNMVEYYVYVRTGNSAGWCVTVPPERHCTPEPKPASVNYNDRKYPLCSADNEFVNAEYGHGDRLARKKETPYSDLVGDSLVWWARGQGYNVDFAFYTGGIIQAGLPKGTVIIADVRNSILSGTKISIVQLTGAQLRRLFDYVADVLHDGTGSSATEAFGQVSQECKYTIDYSFDAQHRHGVIPWGLEGEVRISGAKIVDDHIYTVATSTYLTGGGSGYGAYLYSDSEIKTGVEIWRAVAEYLWYITPPNLQASAGDRIKLIDEDWSGGSK